MKSNGLDIKRLLGSSFRAAGISLSSGRRLLFIMASSLQAQRSNLFLVLLLAMVGTAGAQWSRASSSALRIGDGEAFTDSLGGAFVITNTGRIDWPRPAILWVNREGEVPWGRWIDMCPAANAGSSVSGLTLTAEPGVIIVHYLAGWVSDGDTTYDIRLQKVNTEGELLWGEEGVQIIPRLWWNLDSSYYVKDMVTDGEDGVILTYYNMDYQQQRPIFYDTQRIDGDGNRQWGDEGIHLFETFPERFGIAGHSIASNSGGVIVGCSGDDSVLVQRLNIEGDLLWGANGMKYALGKMGYINYGIPNSHGGAIFCLETIDNDNHEITLLKFDDDGQQLWGNGLGRIVYYVNYNRLSRNLDPQILQLVDDSYQIYWNNLSLNHIPYEYPKVQSINMSPLKNGVSRTII